MADNRKKNILQYSKYIHLKIECEINTMLAGKGITAAQSHVLMYIMEHNGDTPRSEYFPCDGIRAYKKAPCRRISLL